MKKNKLVKLMAIVALLLAATIFAGCALTISGSTQKNPSRTTAEQVQSNTGGAVTIDVKNLGLTGNSLSFEIAMNTHSVNLDQYDLKELAVLRDGKGNEYEPVAWDSAPGGHHRSGTLTFSKIGSQGLPGTLELILRDIAGVQERVFKWEAGTS